MQRILIYIPLSRLWESLPDVPVYAYGFMMMLAFISALWLALRQARRDGIPEDDIFNTAFLCIVSGIVGSRLLYLVLFAHGPMTLKECIDIRNGGLVYYGGLLLAMLTSWLYLRRKGLKWGLMADCFAPGLAAGLGFGRIGCFLNGCCHGVVCSAEAWYAVRFPPGSLVADQHAMEYGLPFEAASLPVWPSQLVESALGFAIAGVLLWRVGRRRYPGQMMVLFVMLYAVARFGAEFLRADTPLYGAMGGWFPGMTAGQIVALVTFFPALWLHRRFLRG